MANPFGTSLPQPQMMENLFNGPGGAVSSLPSLMPTPPSAPRAPSIIYDDKFLLKYKQVDTAIRQENMDYLTSLLKSAPAEKEKGVNLSGDPLLSVVIAYGKTELAVRLVKRCQEMLAADRIEANLIAANRSGDTALHAAAAKGDIQAAEAIVEAYDKITADKKKLLEMQNERQETALHKAALFGNEDMFWRLVRYESNVVARGWEGASVLHCAIMGKAFKLAADMARSYPGLKTSRNSEAVTPLQLIVTIPKAFRSKQHYGPLESLIYKLIPLEDNMPTSNRKGDEESQDSHEVDQDHKNLPPNYKSCFDLLTIIYIPVRWIQVLMFNMLKQVFATVERLERHKKKHKEAMKLITLLAEDEKYWDFLTSGRTPDEKKDDKKSDDVSKLGESTRQALMLIKLLFKDKKNSDSSPPSDDNAISNLGQHIYQVLKLINLLSREEKDQDYDMKKGTVHNKQDKRTTRWDDSPLILGARMGLDEFVHQILKVRPETALWLDVEGNNVLQIAIQYGHEKIVGIVKSLATGNNPRLPSSLLSNLEEKTKNTILHFAAEKTVNEEEAGALQMQTELQWFEKVKRLVPKDLRNSRNSSEKTANELFTENHKAMVQKCKDQIVEMGKTGAGIVAAVVFASSFSIPGERINNNVPVFHNKTAFKVFANAYVIGLSCAATAMVLFLSLLSTSYKQQEFRRAIPTKYFFANMSFFLALVALLVSFSCSIYLNIYGYRRAETNDIIPFIVELTIFPALSLFVLLYRGSTFGVGYFMRHVWR